MIFEDPPFNPAILRFAEEAIKDRFSAAGTVPDVDSFDGYKASLADIERYLLPPRRDMSAAPELDDFYRRMMAPPLNYVVAKPRVLTTSLRAMAAPGPGAMHGGLGAAAPARGRWGTTRNWCGAVVAAHGGRRFERVAARWIVPTPSKPTKGWQARTPPPGKSWQTSVWVGLDGFRRFQLSLPQAGTVSRVRWNEQAGRAWQADAYFFAQWWVRGKPFGEIVVPEVPVAPGDEIYVLLVRRSPVNVSFHVTNRTQNVTTHLAWNAGSYDWQEVLPGQQVVSLGQPLRTGAPSDGLYAVWCAERPGVMPDNPDVINERFVPEPFNLPSFSPVAFGDAIAGLADESDPDAPVQQRDLTAARWFRVTGAASDAGRTRSETLASPGAPARAAANFTVTQTAEA
jgi:hypothetical protein